MSLSQVLIDGLITAAELVALLFVTPAGAVMPAPMLVQAHLTSSAPFQHGCAESVDDASVPQYAAGHARLSLDEAIADMSQSEPDHAAFWLELDLPAHSTAESRALLIDRHDRQFVMVVFNRTARGVARLTLRPADGAGITIELGPLPPMPAAYVIPIASRTALAALAAGAIELEAHADDVQWSTLPAQLRADSSLASLRTPE